jgi:hypothetical protein
MRLKWSKLVVAVMLSLVMGLHWTLLQSFGWVQMFVTFAQTDPVTQALIKTFDGNHPCQVCKLVQSGKATEKKQETKKLQTRFDYWLGLKETLLFPPAHFPETAIFPEIPPGRFEPPLIPPPRPV